MAELPKLDHPVYEDLDLGTLDPELAGRQLRVLRNPTIRFRGGFRAASLNPSASEWSDYVAAICDIAPDKLMDHLGDYQQAIIQALFVSTFDGFEDGKIIGESPAKIFGVWDAHASERRKTYGARS